MARFLLFTTSDMRSGRSTELTRMVDALVELARLHPEIRIVHHLLLQRCDPTMDPGPLPAWTVVHRIENQVSLSAARNLLIDRALAAGDVAADDIVAFPDDDSWYPPGLLPLLADAFDRDTELDFWFCRYSSTPKDVQSLTVSRPALQDVISNASSNTFFFRGGLFSRLGHFDEDLGVGARLNGGEDTEYAIRAFYGARRSGMTLETLVGHRDHNPALKPKYFPGTLRAIARHRGRSAAGLAAYWRKIAVGLVLVGRRELPLARFLGAVRQA